MKTITQLWRLIRLAALTFLAQIVASGGGQLTRASLTAAGVATAEVVYRQIVPAGRLDGVLGNLLAAYRYVKAARTAPHLPMAAPNVAPPLG